VDQNIIVAGCVNGQIVLWDISEYQDRLQSSRKRENEIDESATQGVHTPIVRFSIVSSIESSHRAPVTDIHWLPKHFEMSNNGEVLENGENGDKQIVTGSLDGTIAFWDLRFKKDWKSLDLAWRPFLRIPITAMDNSFDYSVTRVSLKTIFHEEGLN
jgi:WD40 repeat protein